MSKYKDSIKKYTSFLTFLNSKIFKFLLFSCTLSIYPINLLAVTNINTICSSGGDCIINTNQTSIEIQGNYSSITNDAIITGKNGNSSIDDAIKFISSGGTIGTFTNNGSIIASRNQSAIFWDGKTVTINTFNNNGLIEGSIELTDSNSKIDTFNNYGTITGGISQTSGGNATIGVLNNYGDIYLDIARIQNTKYAHINGGSNSINIKLGDYHIRINQDSSTFNNFGGYTNNTTDFDTSHLAIGGNIDYVKLRDADSKLLISIGNNFELNKDYALSKLIIKTDGSDYQIKVDGSTLNADLYSHLITTSSILNLSRNGNHFRISVDTDSGIGNTFYKSNIQSMNNLILNSQSIIFASNVRGSGSRVVRRISSIQGESYEAKDVKENDRFYYDQNDARLRQRQNLQRNTQRRAMGTSNINASKSAASSKYYFFFTPFVTHNILNKNNGVGASGLNYGFVSGFNGMLGDNNTLGVHLGFNYGEVSGIKNSTTTTINTISTMLGLHYKLDLVYDMYIKAIGNFFYFLNDISYAYAANIDKRKPNALGFSGNLYYGKDFNLASYGVFGLEAGVNYQGIQSDNINFENESYKSNLINLIYLDIGTNYNKIFSNDFGFNLNLGVKALMTEAKSKVTIIGATTDFNIGADRFLGYFGAGASYFINQKIELQLNYLGSFGDKSISNSGFFNFRIWW